MSRLHLGWDEVAKALRLQPGDPTVLDFANKSAALVNRCMQVACSNLFQVGHSYGNEFMWDGWALGRDANYPSYIFSDGAGGSHLLLFGAIQAVAGAPLLPSGNVYNGAAGVPFAGDDGAKVGEWYHWALTCNGVTGAANQIAMRVWINGYMEGKVAAPADIQSPTPVVGSANDGWIGGSNHQGWDGRLGWLRWFENYNPLVLNPGPELAFSPDIFPLPIAYDNTNGIWHDCTFLMSFLQAMAIIPDLSRIGSVGKFHAGALAGAVLNGSLNRGFSPGGFSGPGQAWPMPQYVTDKNAPFHITTAPTEPAGYIQSPAPVMPIGAKIWDDFSGGNSGPAFATPTLGSTKGGSLGPLVWQYSTDAIGANSVWGVQAGKARFAGQGLRCRAFVNVGNADHDVRSARRLLANDIASSLATTRDGTFGISFRGLDANHYWHAFIYPSAGFGPTVRVETVGGAFQTDYNPSSVNFSELKAVTLGNVIKIYTDGNLIATINDATYNTGTQVGLAASSNAAPSTMSSGAAWLYFAAL